MGYREMANVSDMNVLFAWLVEEVGELGRYLIRKREDEETSLGSELADVWNTLHAIAYKKGISPEQIARWASDKSKEKIGKGN
jgi:NTP pyrophosphatase (non-canonical NTP hydrolase)